MKQDEDSQCAFCALVYTPHDSSQASSHAAPTILLALRDREGNLRLLIHPEFRALLQDEDRAYFQALLIDLPERAKLQPDALFKQLCSLGVGPLVTQTVGEDLTGNPALLELSSTFSSKLV